MPHKQSIWYHLSYSIVALSGFLYIGCSDLREPLPTNPPSTLVVHPSGWLSVDSTNFHGAFIRNSGWDLTQCQQCHGTDYGGGIANVSCLTCHPKTPEDCVVCHGGVDNQTGAPPEDIDGNRDPGLPGVGAHTIHLTGGAVSSGFDCGTCHVVPTTFDVPGHVDSDLPAEVRFSGLALEDGAVPVWDGNTKTCLNTYCHGNWSLPKAESNNPSRYKDNTIDGNNASPNWTDPGTATCGSCHDLPPAGHKDNPLSSCQGCHKGVVDKDGNIIDKTKHVNGKINYKRDEYPMF